MKIKSSLSSLLMGTVVILSSGCGGAEQQAISGSPIVNPDADNQPILDTKEQNMWLIVNNHRFAMTLADNATAQAFAEQLPFTLDMEELNGNEKHAQLPSALPTDASRPITIRKGDIMLYGNKTLVVFYKTFNSAYSYTRIGTLNNPDDLENVLGHGDVEIMFSRD